MKNIYNTLGMTKACLCALAVSLVTTGCSDLLDKEPPSAISDGSFWTGEGDAMLALTGCYRFQTGWSHDDFATPQGLLYLDFAGGNGTEKENFSTLMASSNTVATNSNLRWYWGNAYTQIYNPQIQISAESETKRSIFREKDKTKRSKKESAQHSKSRNKSFVMTSVSAL